MLNRIVLMGRIVKDPELRHTANDTAVATYTVAVDRDFRSGEDKQTDFFDIVSWRQAAEFVNKYFRKGSMVVISGRLQSRHYTDRDNNKRTVYEIVSDNVYFGETKKSESTASTFTELPDDGDLPF